MTRGSKHQESGKIERERRPRMTPPPARHRADPSFRPGERDAVCTVAILGKLFVRCGAFCSFLKKDSKYPPFIDGSSHTSLGF